MTDLLLPNDIDTLMDSDPTELSAQDIDKIIAWHRAQRARRAAGEKPSKAAGPVKPKIDLLQALGLKKIEPPIKRRSL